MRVGLTALLGLTLAAAFAAHVQAQPGEHRGSPASGKLVADQVCWTCHVVEADQEFPPMLDQKTPSFAEIANRSDVTEASLVRFIGHTHWDEKSIPMTMPNPMLLDTQRRDVAAYILSLRRKTTR